MSPLVSVSADLQSIMPAPVDSRSSLTIWAVIFAIEIFLRSIAAGIKARPATHFKMEHPSRAFARLDDGGRLLGFRGQFLGLLDPTIDAAGQAHFLADVVRGLLVELGNLRVVEDAEIVELLFDRRRYAGQLLEVVGNAARTGQLLEAEIAGGRNHRHR